MTRIAIIDRADMNAEQARVYDTAKQTSGIVGGPYLAYIRLPKLFEASQNIRATLASGPLSRREQQIVNLAVARHWNARYPWYAQARNSLSIGIEQPIIDAINARKTPNLADARERTCFAVASEILANKGLREASYAAAEKTLGLEHLVALVATVCSFSMTCLTAATDRKSTRLNSSHVKISYAVFCLKKKKQTQETKKEAPQTPLSRPHPDKVPSGVMYS